LPVLSSLDLSFPRGADGIPSTRMLDNESNYNTVIKKHISYNANARSVVYRVFLKMSAVQQMLAFIYHVCRQPKVLRNEIYEQFFQAPFVKQFCDQEGIEEATLEASRRRCPFLLNILDACGIIEAGRSEIFIHKLVLSPFLVRPHHREESGKTIARLRAIIAAWPNSPSQLNDEDLSILRELFGPTFLTNDYFLKELEVIEDL
jgi:hypothetical protein